jgi:hypothetical protein
MAAAWLLASVLLWTHGPVQFSNAIVVGLLVVALLPASYFFQKLRFVIAAAGYWLAFSSLTLFFATDSELTAGAHIATGMVILISAIGPFSGVTVIPPSIVGSDRSVTPVVVETRKAA